MSAAFTRRHYKAIARVISELPLCASNRGALVARLCELFVADNVLFDADKFIGACAPVKGVCCDNRAD